MNDAPIALIMLAAGLSRRFGDEDKLQAEFRGAPLASHAARLLKDAPGLRRFAVTPTGNAPRAAIFASQGWEILQNPDAARGQASSLAIAIAAARDAACGAAVICLADMPFVTEEHIQTVIKALSKHDGVMSAAGDVLCPPAGFRASTFPALEALTGDRGARAVFRALDNTATVAISTQTARDIDTPETLRALAQEDTANG